MSMALRHSSTPTSTAVPSGSSNPNVIHQYVQTTHFSIVARMTASRSFAPVTSAWTTRVRPCMTKFRRSFVDQLQCTMGPSRVLIHKSNVGSRPRQKNRSGTTVPTISRLLGPSRLPAPATIATRFSNRFVFSVCIVQLTMKSPTGQLYSFLNPAIGVCDNRYTFFWSKRNDPHRDYGLYVKSMSIVTDSFCKCLRR